MYLARVRRTPQSDPVLAVRFAESDDGGGDMLLLLSDVLGNAATDPVAVAVDAEATNAVSLALRQARPSALIPAAEITFDIPTPTCTKICCLALNYREHAAESQLEVPPEPVLFFKPLSALAPHGATVHAPARTGHLEHEVELAVVIGRRIRDLPADQWRAAVAGYSVINDITARDLQLVNIQRNVPWDQSKGFDTFAPIGPYLATANEIEDPHTLQMTLTVQNEIRQSANTSQMVFGIPEIIADLSNGMTLVPGDVIATGTTAGIAPLASGDVMVGTIEKVGSLVNTVVYEREHNRPA